MNPQMPNGFRSWIETFSEIQSLIEFVYLTTSNVVKDYLSVGGKTGVLDLTIEMTNIFEHKFEGREWDGEWVEEVEKFVQEYLK